MSAGVQVSIRTKIILPYFLLAIIIALGVVYLASQVIFDSIEERFVNQLIEAGKIASKWVVQEENNLLGTMRRISFGVGVPEAVEAGDPDELRELVYPIAVNDGVDAIEILDVEGYSILSMRRMPGGELEEFDFVSGADTFRQADFVVATIHQEVDALGDKFAGLFDANGERFLFIAGPILNEDGHLMGVVLAGMQLDTLVKNIREATLAQVSLYDLAGKPMASTFLEREGVEEAKAQEILGTLETQSYMRQTMRSDIQYREIIGGWNVRGEAVLGLMGVAFAENFLVRLGQQTWIQLLVWVAAALLMVVAIGLFISKRFSRPILDLREAALQVSRGDLTVAVDPVGNDEVAVLAQEFNRMVERLRNTRTGLITAYDRTLFGWAKALEMRDGETEGHSQRVTTLTVRLAELMGLDKRQLVHIQRGALLHDIGKMAIPDSILLKPGPLTEAEWKIMRQHPVYAMEMLKNIPFLQPALDIPHYHHEKWDGSGYPSGLKGEAIPLAARIFAVVDYWDALLSNRPYRPAMSKEETLKAIRAESGKHFDPNIVETFLKMMAEIERENS